MLWQHTILLLGWAAYWARALLWRGNVDLLFNDNIPSGIVLLNPACWREHLWAETSLWCLLGPHKTLSVFIAQRVVSQVMLKFWWCGGRLTWCLLDSSQVSIVLHPEPLVQVSTTGPSTNNISHKVVLVWQNTLTYEQHEDMWLDVARNIVEWFWASGESRHLYTPLGISYAWGRLLMKQDKCLTQTLLTSDRLIRTLHLWKDACPCPVSPACINTAEDHVYWGTADGHLGNLTKALSSFLCRPG